MIEKGDIIQAALLKLGEVGSYNDNSSILYQRASVFLDDIIESVAYDTAFLFNATSTILSTTGNISPYGENEFNIPVDFLNELAARSQGDRSPSANFIGVRSEIARHKYKKPRREGDHYYSKSDKVVLMYCRKITISNIPTYMREYLIYYLAAEMAKAHNAFFDRWEYMEALKHRQASKIKALEGFEPVSEWEADYNG